MYCLGGRYIYIYVLLPENPRGGGCARGWRSDRLGWWLGFLEFSYAAAPGDISNGLGQTSRRRWFWTHVPIIQHVSNSNNLGEISDATTMVQKCLGKAWRPNILLGTKQ
jgi:hypothetical protein